MNRGSGSTRSMGGEIGTPIAKLWPMLNTLTIKQASIVKVWLKMVRMVYLLRSLLLLYGTCAKSHYLWLVDYYDKMVFFCICLNLLSLPKIFCRSFHTCRRIVSDSSKFIV